MERQLNNIQRREERKGKRRRSRRGEDKEEEERDAFIEEKTAEAKLSFFLSFTSFFSLDLPHIPRTSEGV